MCGDVWDSLAAVYIRRAHTRAFAASSRRAADVLLRYWCCCCACWASVKTNIFLRAFLKRFACFCWNLWTEHVHLCTRYTYTRSASAVLCVRLAYPTTAVNVGKGFNKKLSRKCMCAGSSMQAGKLDDDEACCVPASVLYVLYLYKLAGIYDEQTCARLATANATEVDASNGLHAPQRVIALWFDLIYNSWVPPQIGHLRSQWRCSQKSVDVVNRLWITPPPPPPDRHVCKCVCVHSVRVNAYVVRKICLEGPWFVCFHMVLFVF